MRVQTIVPASTAPPTMTTKMKMKMRATVCFLVCASGTGAPRVEIVLQDDRGRRRIEFLLPGAPVLLTRREPALRLDAREPLVLQHDRQLRAEGQIPRELLNPRRQAGRRAIQPARQADND